METSLYHYKAKVRSVYDGDTLRADIDLGMSVVFTNETVRLYGLNAPEVRGPERPKGLKSRDFLREQIGKKDVIIETVKDKKGKYGRYLATIWLRKGTKWVNINELMVKKKFAEEKEY